MDKERIATAASTNKTTNKNMHASPSSFATIVETARTHEPQTRPQVSKRSMVISKVFQAQPSRVIAAEKKFISSINPRNKISLKSVEQLQRERERGGGAANNSSTNRSSNNNNKASSNRKFKENNRKERKTPQQTKQVKWVSTKEV